MPQLSVLEMLNSKRNHICTLKIPLFYSLDNPQECVEFFERANVEYNNNSTKEVYNYVKKTNQHD
jgi:hypothetical protein